MQIHPLIRVIWKQSRVWLALAVVVMNLVNIGLDMDLTREHWASWVQAVGSIAAILGTFALARQQDLKAARLQKKDRLEEDAEMAQLVATLSHDSEVCLLDTAGKMEEIMRGERTFISMERIEELQQSARIIAAKRLTPAIFTALLVLQRELAFALSAVREANGGNMVFADLGKMQRRVTTISSKRHIMIHAATAYRRDALTT